MHIEQFRHELNTTVTILQLRIQLLQRRLARRDVMPEESRLWLEDEMAAMLSLVRALAETTVAIPGDPDLDRLLDTISVRQHMRRTVPDRSDAALRGPDDRRP